MKKFAVLLFTQALLLPLALAQQLSSGSGSGSSEEYVSSTATSSSSASKGDSSRLWHTIEGKVIPPDKKATTDWLTQTQVIVNGGEHVGLLKEDGTFVVQGVPSGSFVVEVFLIHNWYMNQLALI